MSLPKEFLLGAATAAHQVEGNNIHSDYWVQEHTKHTSFAEPSGLAVDHYNRFAEDIALLTDAGLNAYRFSIEWARIEPKEGQFDKNEIEHYRAVLKCCKDNGITPLVTMHHFSSPAWLISKGGWAKEYVVEAFSKYVKYVMEELGDYIDYVCTINEANMGFQLSKIAADMMAASKKKDGAVQVGVNFDLKAIILGMFEQGRAFHCNPFKVATFLNPRNEEKEKIVMRAHQAAKAEVKAVKPSCKVGLTLSLFDYQVEEGGQEIADKLWYEDFGQYFPYIKDDDFIGVQNYTRKIVTKDGAKEPENVRLTQMGYEFYPFSIGNVVRKVASLYDGEIYVTENGVATDNDEERCEYIQGALSSIEKCIEEGINVNGYMHWSLLDNFEWQAGFGKTFGLIAVDRSNMTRHPKGSLKYLGSMAK